MLLFPISPGPFSIWCLCLSFSQATAGSFAKKTARAATVSTVQRMSDLTVLDDEIEQCIAEEEEEFQEQLKNIE